MLEETLVYFYNSKNLPRLSASVFHPQMSALTTPFANQLFFFFSEYAPAGVTKEDLSGNSASQLAANSRFYRPTVEHSILSALPHFQVSSWGLPPQILYNTDTNIPNLSGNLHNIKIRKHGMKPGFLMGVSQ